METTRRSFCHCLMNGVQSVYSSSPSDDASEVCRVVLQDATPIDPSQIFAESRGPRTSEGLHTLGARLQETRWTRVSTGPDMIRHHQNGLATHPSHTTQLTTSAHRPMRFTPSYVRSNVLPRIGRGKVATFRTSRGRS